MINDQFCRCRSQTSPDYLTSSYGSYVVLETDVDAECETLREKHSIWDSNQLTNRWHRSAAHYRIGLIIFIKKIKKTFLLS